MIPLSRAHENQLRALLRASACARDEIPYSPEFVRLKTEFWERSFRKMTDEEFWQALVTVAKKGGIRGKESGQSAPALTPEQVATLLKHLPVPIGQRDRLPYTLSFATMLKHFNAATDLALTEKQLWLAILSQAK
jgi:hypothetical protein